MALEQKLQVKLSQKLLLTPALQQAIKLLQLNALEMKQEITEQLLTNPVLEEAPPTSEPDERLDRSDASTAEVSAGEGDNLDQVDVDAYFQDAVENYSTAPPRERSGGDTPGFEAFTAKKETLEEHLLWQVRLTPMTAEQRGIAEFLCGNLNREGYLQLKPGEAADTLGIQQQQVEVVRILLMALDLSLIHI